jgi:glycine/D-amino acid oxidase-like deaminating enzyme
MRIAVVGGGLMGLSVAWAAIKAGHKVVLVEQGKLPNPLGTSVDQHRLIRHPYGASLAYCRLIDPAFAAWEALWSDLGERLYHQTGTLALIYDDSDWGAQSRRNLALAGVPFHDIDVAEVPRRWPQILPGRAIGAFFVESGGALLAGRIVERLARWLGAQGAEIRTETAVRAVETDTGALVLADGERIVADRIVVAAGAWLPRLVPRYRGRVVPSRQIVVYVEPPEELRAAWAASPMFLNIDEAHGFYVVPPVPGTGLKIGDHRFSRVGEPDRDRMASEAEGRAVLAACRGRLAGFERFRMGEIKTCFYTVTEDESFLAETEGRMIVLSACSGHGFKFGAVIGKMTVEALDGRRAPDQLRAVLGGRET